ncbi:amidase [Roseovarius aestuarii]|nr:amidase [Roseovarius aestuarii]
MKDATALASAIAHGETSASAAMDASLSACNVQADLGAVVYLDENMARTSAEAADAMPQDQRGPFHGVPFLVKDLGGVAKGLPASAGSAAMRDKVSVPQDDSHALRDLRRTGLIPFGLTATPPFGLSLTSEPDQRPPARNPWNPMLTPGGSSGGAAAAVASGIVAIAHATDAAGSIRVPAACCGLTGLKPSLGAIAGSPDFSNHLMGLASELVLARSIRDVATAFEAIHKPLAPVKFSNTPRIALAIPDRCGPEQSDAAHGAAEVLRGAGCEVVEMPAPDLLGAEASAIAQIILAVSLAEWLTAMCIPDNAVPVLAAAMAAEGRATPATALFAVSRQQASLTHRCQELFTDVDAILMPVLSSPPPPVGALALTGTSPLEHFAKMEAFAPNAALANVAGLPALALPFGMSGGMPLGVQLLGPPGADALLLGLGRQIETRAPVLSFPYPIAGLPT